MSHLFTTLGICITIAADPVPAAAPASPPPAVWAEYDALQASTGRDAAAQIKLALWCEEHGLVAQRHQHIARAVLLEPGNVLARGLTGRVQHRGRWVAPEAVAAMGSSEEQPLGLLAEYNARRQKLDAQTAAVTAQVAAMEKNVRPAARDAYRARHGTHPDLAQDRIRLGLWCEKAGLSAEATAEFTTAVRLSPRADEAWRHLGYVRSKGRWVSEKQASAERMEDWAEQEATDRWLPLLQKWRAWLENPKLRAEAEKQLTKIDDTRVVVPVGRVFCGQTSSIADQDWALRILRPIDSPASTRLVAMLAVYSEFDDIRRSARELLTSRPARDYLRTLVEMVHAPAQFFVEPVQGPGAGGLLVVDTPRYRLERSYDAPPAFALNSSFWGYVGYDVNGLPIAMTGRELSNASWALRPNVGSGVGVLASALAGQFVIAEAEQRTAAMIAAANLKAEAAQRWLVADIRNLEQSNADALQVNARIGAIVRETFSAPDMKDDEIAYRRWYFDRIGYDYTPPSKVFVTDSVPTLPAPTLYSCFAAGTLVRTREGPRVIEQIRPGDRVLSQDCATGELAFESVLVTHRNPPARTVRLTLDNGEVIQPSIYHRFWICGRGWVMARDLKPGDALRVLRGRVAVARASADAVVPVYNLDVAGKHTYFVGEHDYLVHDNSLPGEESSPFDAVPDQVAAR